MKTVKNFRRVKSTGTTSYVTSNTDGSPLQTKKLVEGKEMEAMGREEVGDRGKERMRDEGERWAVENDVEHPARRNLMTGPNNHIRVDAGVFESNP